MLHRFLTILCSACLVATTAGTQTWLDSVDRHGREVYMPAAQYKWDWGQATFLNSLVHLYHARAGADKQLYFDYVRQAMEVTRMPWHPHMGWHSSPGSRVIRHISAGPVRSMLTIS